MTKTTDRSDLLTARRLSERMEETPEGYLLCRDVQIARTGLMIYGPHELPLEPGKDGLIHVTRDEQELAASAPSFEGKAITVSHPEEFLGPGNSRELTCGHMRNVRMEGLFLISDLLVTDAEAIEAVRSKKLREVSLGYDADYEQETPGLARQVNIRGNHVALVESGRCGPTCAIGDSNMAKEPKKVSWMDRVRAAFHTKDEAMLNEALGEAPGDEGGHLDAKSHNITINLHGAGAPSAEATDEDVVEKDEPVKDADPMEQILTALKDLAARVSALEGGKTSDEDKADEEETKDADDDPDKKTEDSDDKDEDDKGSKTTDSAGLSTEFADVLRRAEILLPGVKLMTFDAKLTAKKTVDRMCAFRRRTLVEAADKRADIITPLLAGAKIDALTCDAITMVFNGASELARVKTNDAAVKPGRLAVDVSPKGPPTVAQEQERLDTFWNRKK